ncbi:DnaJ domain-containing protein [Sphingomonas aracearum]|uniref:J domain-containing protein n=1 Tax=Sphingomonas aracearum TaxID=2283317 RepID=A0A369VSA4_9SPHN|nr:DnaJ domain-containing protein [Sphingomonas aracearum]RDE04555.1 J domain-containing protein [Sphingomonas aracearum]
MAKLLLIAGILYLGWWLLLRPRPKAKSISEAEACDILGVSPTADAADVRAAHRRLVSAVHPDRGGSAGLTRRINAARDVLLRERS